MRERRQCEYFLLRYAPDVVRNEFVTVGVLLREAASGWFDVRFTRDWKRVRCLDPEADVEVLEGLEREIRERMAEGEASQKWLMQRMSDTFANSIQLTPSQAVLAEAPGEELGRLADIYLERPRRGKRATSGRMQIYQAMRAAFERQGVWRLMRHNLAVSQYTQRGDPLKLDAGYRPAGRLHFYHALALATETAAVKALAFSFPQLRAGVARVEKVETALTVIVEGEGENDDETVFALQTLEAAGIHAAALAEMPRIAQSVRQQMGLQ